MLLGIFCQCLCLAVLIHHTGCERQLEYKKLNKQHNLEEAQRKCSGMKGAALPGTFPITNLRTLSSQMAEKNINNSWIGIRKLHYDNAHWINYCSVGTAILKDTERTDDQKCGYINVMFKYVELTVCDKSHEKKAEFGAICEVKGCTECSLPRSMCFVIGNTCFLIVCGINNWLEARKYCQSHKGDLPILQEKSEAIETFSQTIREHQKECINYWIGFSMFAWYHLNNQTALVKEFDWLTGQPLLTGGDCVSAQRNNSKYGWKVENCSIKHDVLCAKYKIFQKNTTRKEKSLHTPTQYVVTKSNYDNAQGIKVRSTQTSTICAASDSVCCDTKLAWGWGLSMFILLLIAVIYIIYLKRHKKSRCFKQRKPHEAEQPMM